MYNYLCHTCQRKFITDIVNRSKCLLCGSGQVEKIGKEAESSNQEKLNK